MNISDVYYCHKDAKYNIFAEIYIQNLLSWEHDKNAMLVLHQYEWNQLSIHVPNQRVLQNKS